MLAQTRKRLDREVLRSVDDAHFIAEQRRARRRHARHARLYPALFVAVGLVFMYVHFIWHPY